MRTKVKVGVPEAVLERILQGLELELLGASDAEITAAAKELGMDPRMKGSAAFAGLRYPAKPQLSDFFEFEVCRPVETAIEQKADAARRLSKGKARKSPPADISKEREDSSDK
jgi:hypothetical protein